VDLICAGVRASGADIPSNQILAAIGRGYMALLLDGLDEVPFECRRKCISQIYAIIEDFPATVLVVTTRPLSEAFARFQQLEIAPLTEADLAAAIRSLFRSTKEFREKFDGKAPIDYVRSELPREVRQLCRVPLTFGCILTLLANGVEFTGTLYALYDRLFSLVLSWEVQSGRVPSEVASALALGATAYAAAKSNDLSLSRAEWIKVASQSLVHMKSNSSILAAEKLLHVFIESGMLRDYAGSILFFHGSVKHFFVARHLRDGDSLPLDDSLAMNKDIARFLCGAICDVEGLVEAHLRGCSDVESMLPLLEEASRSISEGRPVQLYRIATFAQEVGIHLTYSRVEDQDWITDGIKEVIGLAIELKPKGLSLLKDTVYGLISGCRWDYSALWFEWVLSAFEEYDWPGTRLLRRFAEVGLYGPDSAFDEESNPELYAFLDAMLKDDFLSALHCLENMERMLRKGRQRKRSRRLLTS
jgi:hypothetical protein